MANENLQTVQNEYLDATNVQYVRITRQEMEQRLLDSAKAAVESISAGLKSSENN